MDTTALLRARAADLRLEPVEIEKLAPLLDARVVQAVLAALVQFEDALVELAQ